MALVNAVNPQSCAWLCSPSPCKCVTLSASIKDTPCTHPGSYASRSEISAWLQVTVDRPDVQGRVAILKVHSKGKKISKDVDYDKVARRTPGFTGAHSVLVTCNASVSHC